QVNLNKNFEGEGADFVLQPYDMVFVRTAPGYETQKTVRIEGEVLYPGAYAISKKDERITDIIKRAGGFTSYAYVKGSSLKREGIKELKEGSSRNEKIELQKKYADEQQNLETIASLQQ